MKFTLRDFQKTAVRKLLGSLSFATQELRRAGGFQAITFSAPTASGKTVMMTSLIERVLFGKGGLEEHDDPDFPFEQNAVFLWLSDSPQLNRQSLEKISVAGSSELSGRLESVEATFDQEYFNQGCVYFLNSQKLGAAGLLTNKEKGDLRSFTIWETINNTIRRQESLFYVVIDEAHRGMRHTPSEQAQAKSIMQRFIFGAPSEVNAAPIVIGVSATPERFDTLLQGASRTRRSVNIPANEPREAGLIKDFILMCHKDYMQRTEWTLLAAACKEFNRVSAAWASYCKVNDEQDVVIPLLVIQVEDAGTKEDATTSRTSLLKVIDVIKANIPGLADVNIAHCLKPGATIKIGDVEIRSVEPHRIQHDEALRVAIFKMALTTGWDCPRAEVMMSFRRAEDATYIAQLVGRIVRTPLARRMDGNDLLNSVMLFLPFFNREEVENVVNKLQGDGGESKGADIGNREEFQTLRIAPGKERLARALCSLPTYTSQEGRKVADIRRAQRLAFELALDGWKDDSQAIRDGLRAKLLEAAAQRRKDPALNQEVEGLSNVTYRVIRVEDGVLRPDDEAEVRSLPIAEQDVETVFSRSFVTLTEDLATSYVKARYDPDDMEFPFWRCKIELFLLSQDRSVVTEMEASAQAFIEQIYDKRRPDIKKLSSERRAAYRRIVQLSRHFDATDPSIPDPILLKMDRDAMPLADHLFINENGEFNAKLNGWEAPVLASARAQHDFMGWLRNYPRKSWSVAYTYELNGTVTPGYPDFVVFRRSGSDIVVDLLEPHQGSDSLVKAHGLCRFAELHGEMFGRIDWIEIRGKQIRRLNLNSPVVRQKVKATKIDGALPTLFDAFGTLE